MKIPSTTGFAVVCTTELAFEYLKQTEQMKLIVLIMRPLRPFSATRGFARVSRLPVLLQSRYKMQVKLSELYTSFHAPPINALQQFKINNRVIIDARILGKTVQSIQLASSGTDLSGFCGLYAGCLHSVPITQMHFTINVSNLYIERQRV